MTGWDPLELVPCDPCYGKGYRPGQPARECGECSGTGKRLRGDPPGTGSALTLDFTGGKP
jgi:DnaJ-class molecular chaperone